ncbi:MAG TPA: hypothetical protein VFR03_15460 [Thermoanaerobaculia bacterium]|nr:hypothetical protein [Thermoanaerobaculia bacterium]
MTAKSRLALAAAALWVLPLWVVRFPPMVDYPQQLALSAILRWYSDPVRRFRETYELALWKPHGLFKLLTAGLAWVVPIQVAGKLVVSASLLAVGLAALALCRRAGKPGWYALLALALTYNTVFYWGFVDNLLAVPLALGGVAMADSLFERSVDRPFGWRAWLALAGVCILFYTVHLQFLLLFVGMVGWIALCRRPPWKRLALWLSALVPGVAACLAVMAYGVLRTAPGVISGYERRMRSDPPLRLPVTAKLLRLPDLLFGSYPDWTGWVLLGLLALTAVLAIAFRVRDGEGDFLFRTRFATLALWLTLLYLVLPELRGGYLIASRMAPFAAMVGAIALPRPLPERRRLVAALVAVVVAVQFMQTLSAFLRFRGESAGLEELLAGTAPGENLGGLIFERQSASWPGMPVYLHFPAYYQVEKGGRILFSFAELFQTSARFRPGKSWDDLLREWNDWNPQLFDYRRHGGRFRYFLVRGTLADVTGAFGGDPGRLGLTGRTAGEWWLFERQLTP